MKSSNEKDEKVPKIPSLKAGELATVHESVTEGHEIDKQTADENVNKIDYTRISTIVPTLLVGLVKNE